MDALLRYTLYDIAISLLLLEVGMMLFFAIAIMIVKLISGAMRRHRETSQNDIAEQIHAAMLSTDDPKDIVLKNGKNDFRNIVEVLEKYDHLFNDERWSAIKNAITAKYLRPSTEKYANSLYWYKRQLAARSLLLAPQQADEATLEKLLNDNRYLVRVAAAACITMTPYKNLFDKMIKKMSTETELSQFPYRDALIKADQEKFNWIKSILKEDKDPAITAICLDILSTRYSVDALHLITPFLRNKDKRCRRIALKALANYPGEETEKLLLLHLEDSDWEMRVEAVNGLQSLHAVSAIREISELLDDPIWWVRLQAAMALKSFGKKGEDVLKAQDQKSKPSAYEISQYALALP